MDNFTSFLFQNTTFPDDWRFFRSIAIVCSSMIGIYVGIHIKKKLGNMLFLISVGTLFGYLSTTFNWEHLYTFQENESTYAYPLFGCTLLEEYLRTIGDMEQPLATEWKSIVESNDCHTRSVLTIILSTFLSSSTSLFVVAFLISLYRRIDPKNLVLVNKNRTLRF